MPPLQSTENWLAIWMSVMGKVCHLYVFHSCMGMSLKHIKQMYLHIYPRPFFEWCNGNFTQWSGWHVVILFLNLHHALQVMLLLSYSLKHTKEPTISATHLSVWCNLRALWNEHVIHPSGLMLFTIKCWNITSLHHVILSEHAQLSMEWGLLSIKLGRGNCSPHLKSR
jgi:hypothetical protein